MIQRDDTAQRFILSSTGLHYLSTRRDDVVCLVKTMEDTKGKYNLRQVKGAESVHRLLNVIGRLSMCDLLMIIDGGMIHNCCCSSEDI